LQKKNRKVRKAIATAIISLYLIILYFPIYWLVTMSFKKRIDIMSWPPKWIFKPILENYQWLLSHSNLLAAIGRSFIVTISVVVIALVLGVPTAYVLSRYEFKWKKDIEFWIFSTRFMPAVAVIFPFYLIWIKLNLYDKLPSLVITYLCINLPLVIWIMTGFFRGIPMEYDESARVEGASLMRSFLQVMIPLVWPGLAASVILIFLYTWNDFFFSFILTSQKPTLPVVIASFITQGLEVKYGAMAAVGVIASLPSVIFVCLTRKGLISGMRNIVGIGGGK
jgi:multiple sugar transport system permease protein